MGGGGSGISSAFWSLDRSGADVERQAKVPETQMIGGSEVPRHPVEWCDAQRAGDTEWTTAAAGCTVTRNSGDASGVCHGCCGGRVFCGRERGF